MKSFRSIASIFGLAVLTTVLPLQAQESEFRIGALGTFTGPFSVIGDSMKRGAELAADVRGNKVLNAPIRFIWEDDETKPQVAVQKATRMTSQGVHMLFAPVSSASTFAVIKVAERAKTPFLITISTLDAITGDGGSPYAFRTSNSNRMELQMMANFVLEGGYKKIYLVAQDYKVARDSAEGLRKMLEPEGVSIVGADYPALGARDYSVLANKIVQSDADAVYLGVSGNDLISFLKQSEQMGLQERKVVFGQIVMDESLGKALGTAGLNVHSAMRYHYTIENDANKAFVAAYREKYGEFPDQYAGEAFDGVSWFLDVVESTKSWDKEKWLAAFRGSKYTNSIEGLKTMRTCDNQAEQPGFYGKGVRGEGEAPPITMQLTKTFEPRQLFTACP